MGSGATTCCAQCFRLLFIIVNALFLLIGLALIGVGTYSLIAIGRFNEVSTSNLTTGGIILIVSGVVTAIIAGVGFLGACLKWRPLLVTYSIVLTIIVLLEITAGILGLVYHDKVYSNSRETYSKGWGEAIAQYSNSSSTRSAVDSLQEYLECCGQNNYTDWFEYIDVIPSSCNCSTIGEDCKKINYDDDNGNSVNQSVYTTGCVDATLDYAQKIEYVVGAVGVAFGIFEIIGIIIAVGLVIWISKTSDGYQVV